MLLIEPNFFTVPKQLLRVWRNEFTRVFCDRLNNEAVTGALNQHNVPCNTFSFIGYKINARTYEQRNY